MPTSVSSVRMTLVPSCRGAPRQRKEGRQEVLESTINLFCHLLDKRKCGPRRYTDHTSSHFWKQITGCCTVLSFSFFCCCCKWDLDMLTRVVVHIFLKVTLIVCFNYEGFTLFELLRVQLTSSSFVRGILIDVSIWGDVFPSSPCAQCYTGRDCVCMCVQSGCHSTAAVPRRQYLSLSWRAGHDIYVELCVWISLFAAVVVQSV